MSRNVRGDSAVCGKNFAIPLNSGWKPLSRRINRLTPHAVTTSTLTGQVTGS